MDERTSRLFIAVQRFLAALRPLAYTDMAKRFGYSAKAAGMMCDVVNGRFEHVSKKNLNELARRTGVVKPKKYWRPCLPIEWKDRLTTDGLIALVNEGYRARHVVTATLIEGPDPAFWEYLGIPAAEAAHIREEMDNGR